MRLLLDLGNTRLKWAFANADGVLSPMQALEHSAEAQCWQPLLDAVSQSQMGSIF
ncbi:hypothetical protein HC761_02550 [bacterium]|nr:hypothetical protein [bacterium]